MNNWADHQNNDWIPIPRDQPPKIEVRDTLIYCNGWPAGNLVPTESTNPDAFKEVQAALEEHFKIPNPDPRAPPPGPDIVPNVPDKSFISLLPDDPDLWPAFNDDNQTAKEFALDFEIPDKTKSRLERCEYLNRLLSRKLDIDFDIAWKAFKIRSSELIFPPSIEYKDFVYDNLQKACADFYDYFSIEEEYYIVNEHEPIELNINIDWGATIFDDLGYDWWFDINNHSSYLI